MARRKLTYDDLKRVQYLSAPALSPDGRFACHVVREAAEDGTTIPSLYETDLQTGDASCLSGAGQYDKPAYSPDGSQLAFIGKADARDQDQIWLYDRHKKTKEKLTTMRHGVSEFCWSPDGQTLAYTSKWWPAEGEQLPFVEMSHRDRRQWEDDRAFEPVVIEKLMYKFDETYGVTDQSVRHICLFELPTRRSCNLTCVEFDCYRPSWSQDGGKIAYYGKPFKHVKGNRSALFICDKDSADPRQLIPSDFLLDISPPIFTVDNTHIIVEAYIEKKKGSYIREPLLTSLRSGKGRKMIKGDQVCHGIDALPSGRTSNGYRTPVIQLDRDGTCLYFLSAWDGSANIYRLPLDGQGRVEQVTFGKISIHSFCAPQNGTLLFIRGDLSRPADLYLMNLASGKQIRVTDSNAWLSEISLSKPIEQWVDSKDGKVRIHGLVYPPVRKRKGRTYPVVLNIHGGPESFFVHDFWFEAQMLAAAGLAVICCDPRGSSGYGTDFSAGKYAWGQQSIDDLLAFLDASADLGFIDPDRAGVTGGSYGGHMTVRLIGQTMRFRAAVAQRSLCNLATSYGTGDMGFIWQEENMKTQVENLMQRIEKSPIRQIDNMKTPLLILHATHDYRCSFEQAEQLFIAMKDRNPDVPVRLVAFPGENHDLTRSGRVQFQIAHLREMTEWFKQHLKGGRK